MRSFTTEHLTAEGKNAEQESSEDRLPPEVEDIISTLKSLHPDTMSARDALNLIYAMTDKIKDMQ